MTVCVDARAHGKGMGKSYWFECSRCGYRAKLAGKADDGLHMSVQTILCEDCRELYDAVTRLRILDGSQPALHGSLGNAPRVLLSARNPPPAFDWALNRLRYTGEKLSDWLKFPPKCPASLIHR